MSALGIAIALVLGGPAGDAGLADALAAEAEQQFAAQEYEAASRSMEQAYALDPQPKYLYAQAQAERLRGRCDLAYPLYERYLAQDISEKQAVYGRSGLQDCAHAAKEPPAEAEPELPPPDPEPPRITPSPIDSPPARRPLLADPLGATLGAVGLATLAAGAGVYGAAVVERNRGRDTTSETAFIEHKSKTRRLNIAGATLVGIGSALLVGSIIRYVVVARRRR